MNNLTYQDVLFSQLDYKEIKINSKKKLIRMDLFLSFLNAKTEKVSGIGSDNGWTYREGENELFIHGGILVKGKWPNSEKIEYLDSIKYKRKLQNPYNNFVNPFYLFEIMNEEGKAFFINYYKDDMDNLALKSKNKMNAAVKDYENIINKLKEIRGES